jgi:hypothetical protein
MKTMNRRVSHRNSSLFEEGVALTGFPDMPGYSIDDCHVLIVKYEGRIKRVMDEIWEE